MAPAVVETETILPVNTKQSFPQPIKQSGSLKDFESFDVTPTIGREFPKAKLVEWLKAPNSDELIRDLAVTSELRHRAAATTLLWKQPQLTKGSLSTRRRLLSSSR